MDSNSNEKLQEVVQNCFSKLKEDFYKKNKFEEFEGDNPPLLLSMRDLIESLPPLVKVIEIKRSLPQGKTNTGYLIKYDYSELNSNSIEHCGTIMYNSENAITVVSQKFNLDESDISMIFNHIIQEFSGMSTWDPLLYWHIQFIPGDILETPDILYNEWEKMIAFREIPILSEKFRRGRFENFNEIYGLNADPIISFEYFIKSDSSAFLKNDIETLQKNIAELQLIPQIPKEISKLVKRMKDLYLFGHFRYGFFTISQHYAYLVLESAIKTRYVFSLTKPIVLTDSKKKDLKHQMSSPTYYDIVDFCYNAKGWNVRSLLVNGEAFPYTIALLLDWLEERHFIRKWEKGSYIAGINLRNYFSHPETSSTMLPSASILQLVINEVNTMFHNSSSTRDVVL